MGRKIIKIIAVTILIVFIGYHSVYFRSLSEVNAASMSGKFDPADFADKFWKNEVLPGSNTAIPIGELLTKLKADKENAFAEHSHSLGIGNLKYFLVKGEGEILAVNENDVTVSILSAMERRSLKIATEFVYGNAVRDALGVINMNDFSSTMDINKVSEEINKKIRTEVVPPFKEKVQKGKIVEFAGAMELNQQFLSLEEIEIIPVHLRVK